uniref:Uncharacterized protein n=1 Tax=Burkholderia sp. (strain CCGE1003) TaxID=640512 RepID=E1T7E7_BURSG
MNDTTAELVRWTKDDAIAAAVAIARDPAATAAERKCAHSWILLLTGAIDGFKDLEGEEVIEPSAFLSLYRDSPDAPKVRAMVRANRATKRAAR